MQSNFPVRPPPDSCRPPAKKRPSLTSVSSNSNSKLTPIPELSSPIPEQTDTPTNESATLQGRSDSKNWDGTRIEARLKLLEASPSAFDGYQLTSDYAVSKIIDCFLRKSGEIDLEKIPLQLTLQAGDYLEKFTGLLNDIWIQRCLQRHYRPVDLLRLSLHLYLKDKTNERYLHLVTQFIIEIYKLPISFTDYTVYIQDSDPIQTKLLHTELAEKLRVALPWKCPIHNCVTHDIYISYHPTDQKIASTFFQTLNLWKRPDGQHLRPFYDRICCPTLSNTEKLTIQKHQINHVYIILLLLTEDGLKGMFEKNDPLLLEYQEILFTERISKILTIGVASNETETKFRWPSLDYFSDEIKVVLRKIYGLNPIPEDFTNIEKVIAETMQFRFSYSQQFEIFAWIPNPSCIIRGSQVTMKSPGRVIGNTQWQTGIHYFEVQFQKIVSPFKIYVGLISANSKEELKFNLTLEWKDELQYLGFNKNEYGFKLDTGHMVINQIGKRYSQKISLDNWKGTIGVYVDLELNIIEFRKDGKSLGVAFEGAKIQVPIQPAVFVAGSGTTFTLQETKLQEREPIDNSARRSQLAHFPWKCEKHNCLVHDVYIVYQDPVDIKLAEECYHMLSTWPKPDGTLVRPFLAKLCCNSILEQTYREDILYYQLHCAPIVLPILTEQGLSKLEESKDLISAYEYIISGQHSSVILPALHCNGLHEEGINETCGFEVSSLGRAARGTGDVVKRLLEIPAIHMPNGNLSAMKQHLLDVLTSRMEYTDHEVFDWEPNPSSTFDGLKICINSHCRLVGNVEWKTGKHYWEIVVPQPPFSSNIIVGIICQNVDSQYYLGQTPNEYGFKIDNGVKITNGEKYSYEKKNIDGEWTGTVGVCVNLDLSILEFYRDGKNLGVAFRGIKAPVRPAISCYASTKTELTLQKKKCVAATPLDFSSLTSLKSEFLQHYRSRLIEDETDITLLQSITSGLRFYLQQKYLREEWVCLHISLLAEIETQIVAKKYRTSCQQLDILQKDLKFNQTVLTSKKAELSNPKIRKFTKTLIEQKCSALETTVKLIESQLSQLKLQKKVLILLHRLYHHLLLACSAKSLEERILAFLIKIPTFFNSLLNVTFTLCVVGVLKSGKSTIGDALVGTHFLPSHSLACTALPIRLRHAPDLKSPTLDLPIWSKLNTLAKAIRLHLATMNFPPISKDPFQQDLYLRLQQDKVKFKRAYTGVEAIQKALMDANYLERLGLQLNVDLETKLPSICPALHRLECTPIIDVQFRSLGSRRLLGDLIIVDSPGFNEDQFSGVFDEMVESLIKEADTSLCIVPAGSVQQSCHYEILETVAQSSLARGQKYYVLLNRQDEISADQISVAISELSRRVKNNPYIIPCSAKYALLGWQAERCLEIDEDLPEIAEGNWVGEFAKLGWGVLDAEAKLERASLDEKKSISEAILRQSGLAHLIHQFTSNTADDILNNSSKRLLSDILGIGEEVYTVVNSKVLLEGSDRQDILALEGCLSQIKMVVQKSIAEVKEDGNARLNALRSTIRRQLHQAAIELFQELPHCQDYEAEDKEQAKQWLAIFLETAERVTHAQLVEKFDEVAAVVKNEVQSLQQAFAQARNNLVREAQEITSDLKAQQVDLKLYFQDLLDLGLETIVESYSYKLTQTNEEFWAFVTSHAKVITTGQKRAWWTLWILKFDVTKTKIEGKDIKNRLEQLIKDGIKNYRQSLMKGCYELWVEQVNRFSQRLSKNFEDIQRDLILARQKKGGTINRIAKLKLLCEGLEKVQSDVLAFTKSNPALQPPAKEVKLRIAERKKLNRGWTASASFPELLEPQLESTPPGLCSPQTRPFSPPVLRAFSLPLVRVTKTNSSDSVESIASVSLDKNKPDQNRGGVPAILVEKKQNRLVIKSAQSGPASPLIMDTPRSPSDTPSPTMETPTPTSTVETPTVETPKVGLSGIDGFF